MPGSRGRCAEGPGRPRTHPVLALGVHEARLEHVQGLAQECGASALWRGGGGGVSSSWQSRPGRWLLAWPVSPGRGPGPQPSLGPSPHWELHRSLSTEPKFTRVLKRSSGSCARGPEPSCGQTQSQPCLPPNPALLTAMKLARK